MIDLITALPWDASIHLFPPKPIAGADAGINTIVGWVLKIISLLSFFGLLFVFTVGYESYRHNQAQDFMEKAKAWAVAAIVGANAERIVTIFFPGFKMTAVATSIPGMDAQVQGIVGNVIWILGWAAFFCLVFLVIKGFTAFRDNSIGEFVSKFYWFIIASLGVSFSAQIAGTFFPSALDYK